MLLFERYPKMFATVTSRYSLETGCNGWFDLIDELCSTVQGHIDRNARSGIEIPQVTVNQIKQKFGTLQFCASGGDKVTEGMIEFAESMSSRICERCGAPGKLRGGPWVATRCNEHK